MTQKDFLAHVQGVGDGVTTKEAERWSVAVLIALSQLVSDTTLRRHFVTQLPGFLKSRVLEEPPESLLMNREALLQHIASALGTHVPEAQRALQAVYRAVKAAVAPGQITAFEAHIPKDVVAALER